MPIRRTYTFRIDDDLIDGLQAVWERDGIQVSEQVRRAVRTWLESKGIKPPSTSDRGAARKDARARGLGKHR